MLKENLWKTFRKPGELLLTATLKKIKSYLGNKIERNQGFTPSTQ